MYIFWVMKHVILSLSRYDQPLHEGVVAYAAEHDWVLNSELIRRMGRFHSAWDADGVISYFGGAPEIIERIVSGSWPVVFVQNGSPNVHSPRVHSDMKKALSLAFDYFRRKGFRYFGCYGWKYSHRLKMFETLVEDHGFPCQVLLDNNSAWKTKLARIRKWLRSCTLPMAVFCNNDDEAYRFINLALEAGFDVPGDVAVLGTDNSSLVCTSCKVSLSSIDTNLFEVGYSAARQLDRLMNGDSPTSWDILIEPKGIVERASTDTIGVKSPHIRQAMAIIEADFRKGISIADVVADLTISHTSLIKAFKRELGSSPIDALRDIRMKEAAHLLVSTDEKVQTISKLVGMNNKDYFQSAFKRYFGIPPRQYRLRARGN